MILATAVGMALSIICKPLSNGQQAPKDEDDQTSGGVQVVASVAKEQFKVNEPLKLKLVLVNNSAEERHLISIGPRDYKLDVTDEQGTPAPLTANEEIVRPHEGFSISTGRIILKPGEEHEDYVLVTERHNLWIPGKYFIIAKRNGPVLNGRSRIIKSNKVTVTIE